MSDTKRTRDPGHGEPAFLERWSRRKARARAAAGEEDAAARTADGAPQPADAAVRGDPGAPLPDLDSLGEDSDYSAFMAAGIDESLRREALRKLFRSPKFNVIDGLDDYCRDYTQWEKLGDVVTAEMRHRLERLAQREEPGPASAVEAGGEPERDAAASPGPDGTTNTSPQELPDPEDADRVA